jgi:hypothetical protein
MKKFHYDILLFIGLGYKGYIAFEGIDDVQHGNLFRRLRKLIPPVFTPMSQREAMSFI